MTSATRLFLGLIQPLLVVLLLAGVPAATAGHGPNGERLRAVEASSGLMALPRHGWLDEDALGRVPEPEGSRADGSGDHPAALPGIPIGIEFDRARGIRIGCAFQATAPPTHRACAAPPTGPPILV